MAYEEMAKAKTKTKEADMNNCPDCGAPLDFVSTLNDVATGHTRWRCPKCTAEWEETFTRGAEEKVLHIVPVEGGD